MMIEKHLLKIGEFARVAQVSIATLRHYEKLNLLKPAELDPESGYRYYSLDQLPRLNRLLALKELGFPLEQINQLLEKELSLEQLQGMFKLKQAQTQALIETEQARLTRIATRLQQIEQEGQMPAYEVRLKQSEDQPIVSLRQVVPLTNGLEQAQVKLMQALRELGIQPQEPVYIMLHSRSQQREDGIYIDLEVGIPLIEPLRASTSLITRTLRGGLMAFTIHTGPDLMLGQAYVALHRWIEENHYQMVGEPRQLRLRHGETFDTGQYITEVLFPVRQIRNMDL